MIKKPTEQQRASFKRLTNLGEGKSLFEYLGECLDSHINQAIRGMDKDSRIEHGNKAAVLEDLIKAISGSDHKRGGE